MLIVFQKKGSTLRNTYKHIFFKVCTGVTIMHKKPLQRNITVQYNNKCFCVYGKRNEYGPHF